MFSALPPGDGYVTYCALIRESVGAIVCARA
jgi:hypothetical protein